jgi:hypothetical protein
MTAEQLAELTALVEDYPGPWETLGGYGFSQRRGYYLARDGLYLGRIGAPVRNEAVALCRLASAVPALLARIAELEAHSPEEVIG